MAGDVSQLERVGVREGGVNMSLSCKDACSGEVDVENMNKQVMASYKTANGLTKSLDGDEAHLSAVHFS